MENGISKVICGRRMWFAGGEQEYRELCDTTAELRKSLDDIYDVGEALAMKLAFDFARMPSEKIIKILGEMSKCNAITHALKRQRRT